MYYIDHCTTPFGPVTLASDGTHLTGLWFDGQKYYASTLPEGAEHRALAVFTQTRHWLDCYFGGEPLPPLPPLRPEGSPFRQAVWQLLLEIPYGQTATYGALAEVLARRQNRPSLSAQAVGGAVGHNPISILIPCHRVLGSGGRLTGYAGGLERKAGLLALEREGLSRQAGERFPGEG